LAPSLDVSAFTERVNILAIGNERAVCVFAVAAGIDRMVLVRVLWTGHEASDVDQHFLAHADDMLVNMS
jgi:hypothetical protein